MAFKINIPDFKLAFKEVQDSIKRFPASSLMSVLGTLLFIYLIGADIQKVWFSWQGKLVLTALIAIPLGIAARLLAETLNSVYNIPLQVLALILAGLYPMLGNPDVWRSPDWVIYNSLLAASVLLVSVAGWLNQYNDHGFWQFNEKLFIRFVMGGFFSGVFYAGLSFALIAIDKLFNINMPGRIYAQLIVFIGGIIHVHYQLTGIPSNKKQLSESQYEFPKWLLTFTRYVLIPLVVLYSVILYVYLIKIIYEWKLPHGWVSGLSLGYLVAGIFTMLLMYPLRHQIKTRWVFLFWRIWFAATIPVLVLLFVAINERISQYGITEFRYLVIEVGIWAGLICTYYLIPRNHQLRLIPISLIVFVLVPTFGPWGIVETTERSQYHKMENDLITINNLIKTETNSHVLDSLKTVYYNKLSSSFFFFEGRNRLKAIQPLFHIDFAELEKKKPIIDNNESGGYFSMVDSVLEETGLTRFNETTKLNEMIFDLQNSNYEIISIDGYSFLTEISVGEYATNTIQKVRPGYKVVVTDKIIQIDHNATQLTIDLDSVFHELMKKNNWVNPGTVTLNENSLCFLGESQTIKYKIVFGRLTTKDKKENYALSEAGLTLLFRPKK